MILLFPVLFEHNALFLFLDFKPFAHIVVFFEGLLEFLGVDPIGYFEELLLGALLLLSPLVFLFSQNV
jgi:hypothetical protein